MEFVFENRVSDSPLIDWVWRTQSDREGTFISQAACNWEMVVSKYNGETHITVRGPETIAMPADSPAVAEFFGFPFKLGTFMPRLPVSMLVNGSLMLPKATGNSFWLNSAVWEIPTFDNVDVFVNRMIHQGILVHDPIVEAALQGQGQDVSLRSLQYRFLNATGLTQATIRQIERARHAAELLRQGVTILDTVYETGYFDQAHLTRSLKRFLGQTPSQVLRVRQLA
jgi:AraC-like DNA-binding protein